jgi:hypothetical protein
MASDRPTTGQTCHLVWSPPSHTVLLLVNRTGTGLRTAWVRRAGCWNRPVGMWDNKGVDVRILAGLTMFSNLHNISTFSIELYLLSNPHNLSTFSVDDTVRIRAQYVFIWIRYLSEHCKCELHLGRVRGLTSVYAGVTMTIASVRANAAGQWCRRRTFGLTLRRR